MPQSHFNQFSNMSPWPCFPKIFHWRSSILRYFRIFSKTKTIKQSTTCQLNNSFSLTFLYIPIEFEGKSNAVFENKDICIKNIKDMLDIFSLKILITRVKSNSRMSVTLHWIETGATSVVTWHHRTNRSKLYYEVLTRGPLTWSGEASQITRFMGPTWGPHGADRTQVGPMLALWTLLSGMFAHVSAELKE